MNNICWVRNRRAFFSPPLSPAQPKVVLDSYDTYHYMILFDGMFGTSLKVGGAEKSVNNSGNFYKVCLSEVEAMEKEDHDAPWLRMPWNEKNRKGEGTANGRTDSSSSQVAESLG